MNSGMIAIYRLYRASLASDAGAFQAVAGKLEWILQLRAMLVAHVESAASSA